MFREHEKNENSCGEKEGEDCYVLIISITENVLNVSVKRYRLAEWIKTPDPATYGLQETHLIN